MGWFDCRSGIGSVITWWVSYRQKKIAEKQDHVLAHMVKLEQTMIDTEKHILEKILRLDKKFDAIPPERAYFQRQYPTMIRQSMLILMAWLCTNKQTNHSGSIGNSQMCIVSGPNIDIATKLIKRLKGIFNTKLGKFLITRRKSLQLNDYNNIG